MGVYTQALLPPELKHAGHVQRCMLARAERGIAAEKRRAAIEERACRLGNRSKKQLSRPSSAPQLRHTPLEQRMREAHIRRDLLSLQKEQSKMQLAAKEAERDHRAMQNAEAKRRERLDRLLERHHENQSKAEQAEFSRAQMAQKEVARQESVIARIDSHISRKDIQAALLKEQHKKQLLRKIRADAAAKYRDQVDVDLEYWRQALEESWQQKKYELDLEELRKHDKLDDVKWLQKQLLTEKHALQQIAYKCDFAGNYEPLLRGVSDLEARWGLPQVRSA
eukprot:TRINITY_DN27567_c0_g1_i1.p1 TRINITY_DN27567_c0_g1~~TRINITY_DN27567_c0_g1_i1.p1  ORF type:complete len:280 (+),score=58.89 TRINITY_DN27567_c0_g1_i1:63-902(+)